MWSAMFRPLFKNPKFIVGITIFIIVVLMGLVGPILYPKDPNAFAGIPERPPCKEYPLGTDTYGGDLLAKLLNGIRSSLYIGVIVALISMTIGLLVGIFSAIKGGVVDEILMAITNVVLTIPSILLAILIASYLNVRSLEVIALILGVLSWPWFARAIRAQLMSLSNREYVYLSRLAGYGDFRLAIEDLIPAIATYTFMSFILFINGGILGEASLSLIGLGPTKGVTLGTILQWATLMEAVRRGLWWWFIPPGVVIVALTSSLLIITTAMDEVFNPKLRER
ncbi:MAG TPA: ABC transporter permease [Dictyoglomaceae bacterium]|nr:ABC transporter permease [Dictyoglomaceae bacterium]HOL39227.1 ABC transporter permease [Dictyoglomaceae bacterium]HPP15914.1 ABC transporter permease [Dictyoglomaceae bacterium]HPU43127.1 ABC transporter permease [Dictyoglomaceae bacterium]